MLEFLFGSKCAGRPNEYGADPPCARRADPRFDSPESPQPQRLTYHIALRGSQGRHRTLNSIFDSFGDGLREPWVVCKHRPCPDQGAFLPYQNCIPVYVDKPLCVRCVILASHRQARWNYRYAEVRCCWCDANMRHGTTSWQQGGYPLKFEETPSKFCIFCGEGGEDAAARLQEDLLDLHRDHEVSRKEAKEQVGEDKRLDAHYTHAEALIIDQQEKLKKLQQQIGGL